MSGQHSRPASRVAQLFRRMPAGHDAVAWGRRCGDDLGEAWLACERGDWLLWLAGILEVDPRAVTLAACDCVRFALALLPQRTDELELVPVVTVTEAWARGEATLEECREASKRCLAIYQDPQASSASTEPPTYGYAAAAVSAAANVPTYETPLGVAAGAQAAAQASAQVATPNDEEAIADAHRRCADLVRERIPIEELMASPGFRSYVEVVETDL